MKYRVEFRDLQENIQYFKVIEADNRTHARELVKEMYGYIEIKLVYEELPHDNTE